MIKKREPAPISVWRTLNLDDFILGAAYYPEHVDKHYWERDAEMMVSLGFNVVRMGEFAWHMWEPNEGGFSFDFFDEVIDILGKKGIKTILCTPTATPPRWLTARYPEVLRVDSGGRPSSHGSRQHCDTTSPVLRMHSRRITTALAEHYKNNNYVVGWQTDNELNNTVSESFSRTAEVAFQSYVQKKYQTIGALNFAWGGNFWANAYDNFDQVVLPYPNAPSYLSPGHVQDYHRFLAYETSRFQHEQVEILRKNRSAWFIFHNLGKHQDVDFRSSFGKDLDFIGFDIYPMLYDERRRTGGHAATQALELDICRSYAGNFIVPEQAAGMGSQPAFSTMNPEPGEMHRMAISSVARGADGMMFFRWQPAMFGAEIYWMGLLDHDGSPRRRFREAKRFAHDVEALKPHLLGTHVHMDVAIAGADFDNQEAHNAYPIGLPSPIQDAAILHRYCYEKLYSCGFIHPQDDLAGIKVLYVPHWVMWNDVWNDNVESFINRGGTLVIGAMTGTRDKNNHIRDELPPGDGLSSLSGVRVEEFGRLCAPGASGLFRRSGPSNNGMYVPSPEMDSSSASRRYYIELLGERLLAAHLYERITIDDDVEVIGRWASRFLIDEPAITCRRSGQGYVYYVATYLTDELVSTLSQYLFEKANVTPLIKGAPVGIEASLRKSGEKSILFVSNTTNENLVVNNVPSGVNCLKGNVIKQSAELEGYESLAILLDEHSL